MTKGVGIIAIQHESNTFIAAPTRLEDFRRDVLLVGDEIRERYAAGNHEVSGMFQGLAAAGIEAVPILMALALPSGTVAAEAFDALIDMVLKGRAGAGKLDGLIVAPHGAGVSQNHRDMDGYWLTLLRERVGRKIPIVCTLDPHANVSQRMIDACDCTLLYRTNPHIDQKILGEQAAGIMARTLRGEIRPTQALAM